MPSDAPSPQVDRPLPSFSVVIPCYNQGRYLRTALASVQDQSHPAAEIIVVDDGSTEETAAVAAEFPSVMYRRQPNQGLSAARNAGLRTAQGDYVLFLDADDWLLPDALSAAKMAFDECPDAGLVAGGHAVYTESTATYDVRTPVLNGDAYEALLRRNVIEMHGAVAYDRAGLETIGGFDASVPACEDYDVYLRFARHSRIYVHEALVAVYRRHEENMSKDPRLMLSSILDLLDRQPVERPEHVRARRAGRRHYTDLYGSALAREIGKNLHDPVSVPHTIAAAGTLLRRAPGLALKKAGRSLERSLPRFVRRPLRRLLGQSLPPGDVHLGDLRRTTPFSRDFGFDRGTPVDRYYIERFLDAHRTDVRGRVLEIQTPTYTRRFGDDRVTQSDVLHLHEDHPGATITSDLTDAPQIPDDTFDCIIFTQTLQSIYDTEAAVETLHRILKPGGVLLGTVPGITQTPPDPECEAWYWSFTSHSLSRLAETVFSPSPVTVNHHGNVLSATAFLYGLAAEELGPDDLSPADPDYEVLLTLRAEKSPRNTSASDPASSLPTARENPPPRKSS